VVLAEDKEEEESVGVGGVTAHCCHYFKSTWPLLLLDKRLIFFRIYAVLFCSAVFHVSSQTVRQPDIWAST
jgi:hypothetical protein